MDERITVTEMDLLAKIGALTVERDGWQQRAHELHRRLAQLAPNLANPESQGDRAAQDADVQPAGV